MGVKLISLANPILLATVSVTMTSYIIWRYIHQPELQPQPDQELEILKDLISKLEEKVYYMNMAREEFFQHFKLGISINKDLSSGAINVIGVPNDYSSLQVKQLIDRLNYLNTSIINLYKEIDGLFELINPYKDKASPQQLKQYETCVDFYRLTKLYVW